jgi:hypothetical protein
LPRCAAVRREPGSGPRSSRFLVSAAASYVNGRTIVVGGGTIADLNAAVFR